MVSAVGAEPVVLIHSTVYILRTLRLTTLSDADESLRSRVSWSL